LYGELDISHFKDASILAINEKEMLASPEGHSFPHIMPICYSAQLDPLIIVPMRTRVEHREEHLPYWARVSFESRRNPE
jgi:hypothetical protein